MPSMKAIPTVYRGVQFRSRLEATWAAFFDQLGITWEYEPAIYDTPGWTPDFLVGSLGLVEVKPVEDVNEWQTHDCLGYIDKRLSEYGYRPVNLLGARPQVVALASGAADECAHRGILEMAVIGLAIDANPSLDVCSTVTGSLECCWDIFEFPKLVMFMSRDQRPYLDIVWSVYDSTPGTGQDMYRAVQTVDEYWARAKNLTQWRAPR